MEAITLFIDPSCPFAWITSRWLLEVEQVRAVDAGLSLVSLSVINEGRDLEPWYRAFNDRAWGPARVAAAVLDAHGEPGLRAFYDAFGTRRHVDGVDDPTVAVPHAVAAAGLPAALAEAAHDTSLDAALRAHTARALDAVRDDVGTPILQVGDRAFFGPVLTSIPRGEDAGRLYDALTILLAEQRFCELKRGRTEELQTA